MKKTYLPCPLSRIIDNVALDTGIVAALDKNPGKSTKVGHSFGGIVASQVSEARPDKV